MSTETQTTGDFDAMMVSVILEVAAENRDELGVKLYGYDDFQAECELAGCDPEPLFEEYEQDKVYNIVREELHNNGYDQKDVEDLQDEVETVNELLDNAVFNSHPVMYRANGYNLGSPTDMTEIPHFNHGANNCDDVEACKNKPDSGGVFRTFDAGNLILKGTAPRFKIQGQYELRSDVRVKLTVKNPNPTPGKEAAIPLD